MLKIKLLLPLLAFPLFAACYTAWPLMPDKINVVAPAYPDLATPVAEYIGFLEDGRIKTKSIPPGGDGVFWLQKIEPVANQYKTFEYTYTGFDRNAELIVPITRNLGKKLEEGGIILDRSYKFPGTYSLSELANYKSSTRYITYIEKDSQEIIMRDKYLDNSATCAVAGGVLWYTIIIPPAVCLSRTHEADASFYASYFIYIYDTLKKEIIRKEEVIVHDKSGIWEADFVGSPKETYEKLGESFSQIVANAIAKKYAEIFKDLPQDSDSAGMPAVHSHRRSSRRVAN